MEVGVLLPTSIDISMEANLLPPSSMEVYIKVILLSWRSMEKTLLPWKLPWKLVENSMEVDQKVMWRAPAARPWSYLPTHSTGQSEGSISSFCTVPPHSTP